MEDRFLRQLKKGVLEMLVLGALCEEETHGYGLLSRFAALPEGLFGMKEGTLYPILYRLEDEGMIASRWQTKDGRGAPKKLYAATPLGRQTFAAQRETWAALRDGVDSICEGGTGHEG